MGRAWIAYARLLAEMMPKSGGQLALGAAARRRKIEELILCTSPTSCTSLFDPSENEELDVFLAFINFEGCKLLLQSGLCICRGSGLKLKADQPLSATITISLTS